MNAYHATPTADLYDLIVQARKGRPMFGTRLWQEWRQPVSVALWEPGSCDMTEGEWLSAIDGGADVEPDPRTALAIMSAALYVRLFPKGHYGPIVLDGGAE